MTRLKAKYQSEVAKAMMEKFNYKNVMEIPKLEKVVINTGLGDIKDNSKYKELIRSEAEKYGTNFFDFHNAKIELAEVGTKYDFSSTNDFELFDMEKQFEELKTK